MKLNDKFTFGKYNGRTLKEVWTGVHTFNDSDVIIRYLKEFFDFCLGNLDETVTIPISKFNIDKLNESGADRKPHSKISIMVTESEIRFNTNSDFDASAIQTAYVAILTGDFKQPTKAYPALYNGNHWINNFEGFSINSKDFVALQGDPDYVHWCVMNLLDFFVEPKDLEELSLLDSRYLKTFNTQTVGKHVIEYSPVYVSNLFRLNNDFIDFNNSKK
jgi:hypothetical protein